VLAAFAVSACKEVEEEGSTGYEPAKLEEISEDLKRVTFTQEGAARVGLRTGEIRERGGAKVAPYAALIYDAEGKTYVYTVTEPRTFLRQEVEVDRIDGNRVLVTDGPPAGTRVVTTGAAEVYGTELEIAEKH
jgi:multidrug efflux pump subunit AcrA (membrane-fusion protein)